MYSFFLFTVCIHLFCRTHLKQIFFLAVSLAVYMFTYWYFYVLSSFTFIVFLGFVVVYLHISK